MVIHVKVILLMETWKEREFKLIKMEIYLKEILKNDKKNLENLYLMKERVNIKAFLKMINFVEKEF